MDLELKDPWILKCNILQVLINYPNGIRFGDFIGAFYEIHHFHPQFSHYGYSSLRELLDDMRKIVVVEGSKSGKPVMKLANDVNFDGWLDEKKKNGLDNFEEDHPRLKEEEGRQEETAATDLAAVLAAITNLLMEYESGLKIKKFQAILLSEDGIDLETFSITKGYKNVLMFLDDQIPGIKIRWQGIPHKCVVQLPKDLTVASVPICSILQSYPDGLQLTNIKEAVKKKCGYDLEVFCYQVGYDDIVSCLQQIPELIINKDKNRNCHVRLKSASFSCSSSQSSHSPSFDAEQSICTSNNSNQDESEKKPALSEVMTSLIALLSKYTAGLRVKKLQDFLLAKEGIDLEKFSIAQGHKGTVEFLEQKMPRLKLNYQTNRLNSVVKFDSASFRCSSSQSSSSFTSDSDQSTCTSKNSNQFKSEKKPALSEVMTSLTALLSKYMAGLRVKKLQDFLLAKEGIDLEKFSIGQGHKDTVEFLEQKMPQLLMHHRTNRLNTVVVEPHSAVLNEVMASLTALINRYKTGLRVKKLQDFLLAEEGIDLENISIALGHKDTVEFLEQKMPQLILNYRTNRLNTVVLEPHSDLKDISKPASTISDLSASDSQHQNVPASIALVPPEINKLSHTKQPGPATMTSNFPSFQEPHNALSVKVKSSSRFPSIVLSQQAYQLSANSHTEDLPSHSNVMTFQTSAVQDKLKQQVAQILAMYPEGMSLFQFRIAYSATFKQHFPVGNAASTKQRLLEMPDTVYMRGHGVQALLLPVSPDVSPAKPGQPASSKVENVAVVPSHALVHPVTLTKPAVKIFESCLEPAVPKVAMMPVPKPHNSFLQYYESIRAPENNGNKPFTEFHPQSVPGFIKIVQTDTSHLNGPSPKLREIAFIPHFCAALPTCSQGTVCGDNLPPGILKSRFASPTNSKISDTLPSVDLTPVPPVSVKPEIYSPRSTSQSSVGIRPSLLVQPPFPILSTEQRNSNHAIAEFDSFSEVQKQSRTLQHFSSPDSSAKRNSVSPLFRNSASFFPPRSQPDHLLQQPTHARLDGLQPSSVSLADKGLLKTSLDRVSPVAMYQREPTYVNPLETSSTSESFSTCSVSGPLRPLHTSSVIANNSMALSSVSSSGTEAVSPVSSPIDSIASASANITSNSSPLFPETPTSTQQRQYASAAATVISNKKTTSPTSLSSESTTSSHYQFAYASSRMTTSSSALSSETYAFTHQRQNAQAGGTITASSTKTVSSISSLDSSTSLSCHHVYASAKPSSRSSVLSPEACAFSYQKQQSATGAADSSGTRSRSKTPSPSKSTAYHTPNVASRTTLNHDPSSQDNVTSSFSKQGNHYMSSQEKQMPEPTFTSAVSRIYDACLIL
ncbi:hypothetical protein Chor_009244 [Crotalus horridus]